jgi:ferritin-like metal-binding protein YciE
MEDAAPNTRNRIMPLNSLHDLYVEELKDLYNAENQLLKALPQMARKAAAPELKAAFTEHLEVTNKQIERLNAIFAELDVSPKGKKCKAMEGLIAEGKEVIDEKGDAAVIDAALIATAQRIEHYEIAGYGCLRTFANLLGYTDAANHLQETLNEEGEADKKLTHLAETVINAQADEVDEDDPDEPDDDEVEEDEDEMEEDEPAPTKPTTKQATAKPNKK